MRRAAITALATLAVALSAVACGSPEDRDTTPDEVVGSVPVETGGTETGGGSEGGEQGDPEAGAEVFVSAGCGTCHVLADAGTTGAVGPDLDQSQPDFDLVVDRVTNGAGVMPSFRDQLTPEQIIDVAGYVVQATSG